MNIFRKSVAGLLVSFFVCISIASFTIFAFNNTFLKKTFYVDSIKDSGYEYLVNTSAAMIYRGNSLISRFFTETDLRREIGKVFTPELFASMLENMASQIGDLKNNASKTITVPLKLYRDSLLTLAHNLAFEVFQSIPKCSDGSLPEVGLNSLPTCIPEIFDYNIVVGPVNKLMERAIYGSSIPEEVKFDLNKFRNGNSSLSAATVIDNIGLIKFWLYGALLLLLVSVALVIYRPFSLVIFYEGMAFLAAGVCGYIFSFGLQEMPKLVLANFNIGEQNPDAVNLFNTVLTLFSHEIQKIALIYVGLGAVLIIVRLFMQKNQKSS
jgi:hypothetical protein